MSSGRSNGLRSVAAIAGAAALVCAGAGQARADSTGWVSLNGGAAIVTADTGPTAAPDAKERFRSQLQFDAGVGTAPSAPIIVGGLFRIAPTLGEYTDFSWVVRGANRTFQTGPIGVALDVGFYARADDVASIGLVGGPVLGGPLGLQLSLQGHVGSEDEMGASALLGVDLLRLTLYRESLLEWWPNPSRPDDHARR